MAGAVGSVVALPALANFRIAMEVLAAAEMPARPREAALGTIHTREEGGAAGCWGGTPIDTFLIRH